MAPRTTSPTTPTAALRTSQPANAAVHKLRPIDNETLFAQRHVTFLGYEHRQKAGTQLRL